MIGMWGARESGKTAYLISLYIETANRQDTDSRWTMEPLNERARKHLLYGYKRFKDGLFPERDDPSQSMTIDPLRYRIGRPINGPSQNAASHGSTIFSGIRTFLDRLAAGGSDSRYYELELLDPAGEFFSNPAMLLLQDEIAAKMRQSLADSTGLICLIDPDQKGGDDFFELLFQNFTFLSQLMNGESGGPLPIPIAMCVAKADRYPAAFNDPRLFLHDLLGRPAFSVILTFCRDIEFFAVSAVGKEYAEAVSAGKKPDELLKPVKVLEPVEWLLGRVG